MPRPNLPRNTAAARQQRRALTLPEVLLWERLRGSPGGVKFRRQQPVGVFVLDFYCAKTKLGIEIDGIAHDMGDRPVRDVQRDAWLAEQGIMVVRIPATDVLKSPDDVAEMVVRRCLG